MLFCFSQKKELLLLCEKPQKTCIGRGLKHKFDPKYVITQLCCVV